MKRFPPCRRIHFSKVLLCTEPFVSTLFLLNKKGELYYCANESSRQRQILPRFLLISKSYGASEVPQKLTYSTEFSQQVSRCCFFPLQAGITLPCPGQLQKGSLCLFRTRTLSPCHMTPTLFWVACVLTSCFNAQSWIYLYVFLGIVWKCGFRCCSVHFHIQLNMYGLFTIVVWESLDICEIIS